jgi:hypothetical protein
MTNDSWFYWPTRHRRVWTGFWLWTAVGWFVVFLVGLTRGERWWLVGFNAVTAYAAGKLGAAPPPNEKP